MRAWLPTSAFVLILKCPLRLPCVWPSTCTNAGIGRDPVWNHSLRCANHKRMHGSWFAAHMREEGCTVVRGTTARRGRESGTHSPPHGSLTAALFAQWQDWRHCHPPRRRGGPPSVRRCARQHARTRRTHRRLLDARLRRARHRATAIDTGPGPHPANATTVRPRLRRSRLTCPAARLTPRPTPAPRSLSSPPRIGIHQVARCP